MTLNLTERQQDIPPLVGCLHANDRKTEFSARTRAQNIDTLKTERLDVLVIGGGIVGAGIIRDVALNGGIRAGLIEQGDFGSGTSSATSQLVHGGFRYLSKGDIALVKEARREREVLLRIAPNVVKPLPIVILCYTGDRYPFAGIQMAAHYYNHLSQTDRAEKSEVIRDAAEIQHRVGAVQTEGLKGAVIIWDSTVDDARLCLLTLKDAYLHGASVANYVRFLDFLRQTRSETVVRVADSLTGEEFEVRARHIVSATGPWTDKVWEKEQCHPTMACLNPASGVHASDNVPKLTTQNAKGIHICVAIRAGAAGLKTPPTGIATFTRSEKSSQGQPRVIFFLPVGASTANFNENVEIDNAGKCLPCSAGCLPDFGLRKGKYHHGISPNALRTTENRELLLIGTTETHSEGAPEAVRPTAAEVDYLLAETNRIFPSAALTRSDVVSAYAGVRPLIAPKRHPMASANPTCGVLASAMKPLRRFIGRSWTQRGLFHNGDYVSRGHTLTESASGVIYIYGGKLTTHRQIAEETVDRLAEKLGVARHCQTATLPLLNLAPVGEGCNPAVARLMRRYGDAGTHVIQKWMAQDATLSEAVTAAFPFVKAEVLYAFWGEMAMNLEDFLWRRTRIGLTPGQGVDIAPQIAQFLGEHAHWDAARITAEVKNYCQRIEWLNAFP